LKVLQQQVDDMNKASADSAATRDQMQADLQQTQQRHTDLQQQLAKLTDDVAARNKELAVLESQRQSARQEIVDTQLKLQSLQQELAKRSAEAASEAPNAAGASSAATPAPGPDVKSESSETPK
jgi:septal ring factor EnvC (AmiA/AmiB activator)